MPRWVWLVAGGGALVLLVRAVAKRAGGGGTISATLVAGKGIIYPGGRYHFVRKGGKVIHKGIDVWAAEGTPVAAAALGTVEMVGPAAGGSIISGYGEYVILRHAGGIRTLYAHFSKIHVRAGQRVSQGQVIGAVGHTAYGECGKYFCNEQPHVHFEVITADGPINKHITRTDPVGWLAARGMRPAVGVAA